MVLAPLRIVEHSPGVVLEQQEWIELHGQNNCRNNIL